MTWQAKRFHVKVTFVVHAVEAEEASEMILKFIDDAEKHHLFDYESVADVENVSEPEEDK